MHLKSRHSIIPDHKQMLPYPLQPSAPCNEIPFLSPRSPPPPTTILNPAIDPVLLINMPIPRLLRPTPQHHHHAQQQRHIQPHQSKQRREHPVQEAVREITKRTHAIDFHCRHERTCAHRVLRERVIQIPTALEFLLDEALGEWRLLGESGAEVGPRLERGEPDADADEEGDVRGGDDQPAGEAEPGAFGGEGGAGEGDEEGEEDEDCVDCDACGDVSVGTKAP